MKVPVGILNPSYRDGNPGYVKACTTIVISYNTINVFAAFGLLKFPYP
jgi:hypothetical protein